MTEQEIRNRISQLGIDSNTKVVVEYSENNNIVERVIRINFGFNTNIPAIANGVIGASIQVIQGSNDFMPIVGGILITNILSLNIE